MAKKIKLTQGGVVAYPITIVEAIADAANNKSLSEIITGLKTEAGGWKLEQDANSSLVYHLKDSEGNSHGTINIPQDTFLAGATFDGATSILTLTFNTASGKEAIEVPMQKLVDTYTAGNGLSVTDKKFDLVIKAGEKYLEVTADGIATKGIDDAIKSAIDGIRANNIYLSASIESNGEDATFSETFSDTAENALDQALQNDVYLKNTLEGAVATLNQADQTNANDVSALKGIVGTQKDAAATGDTATAFGRIKNLETVVADLTGSGDGTVESVETQINNAINALKGDAESATVGAVEDIAQQGVADAAAAKAAADKAQEDATKANNDLAGHIADNVRHITADERTAWNGAVQTVVVTGADSAESNIETLEVTKNGTEVTIDTTKLVSYLDGLNSGISVNAGNIDTNTKAIKALLDANTNGLLGEMGTTEYADVTSVVGL